MPFVLTLILALALAVVSLLAALMGRRAMALIAAAALLVLHASLYWRFTVDDAFITFRYARHWAAGLGPVYQAGERLEGYTSPAWTAILATAIRIGLDPEVASKVLGLLFALASLPFVRGVADRLGVDARVAGLAPLVLACSPLFAAWACAGMDAPMFAAVVVAGAWALTRCADATAATAKRGRGSAPLSAAILLGLSTWVRPDGWCFVLAGFLALVTGFGPEPRGLLARLRSALPWLVVAIAVAAPCAIARGTYYGELIPNTYYAKTPELSMRLVSGGQSFVDLVSYLGPGFVGLVAAGALLADRANTAWRFLVIAMAAYIAFVVWVGGDVLHLRFYVHVLPLLAAAAAAGAAALATSAREVAVPRRRRAVTIALAMLGVALAWQQDARALASSEQFGAGYVVGNARNVQQVNAPLGRWLAEHAPRDWLLATWDIGAIGDRSGLPILDLCGLTDRTLGHAVHEGRPDAERMAYVRSREPDVIVTYVRPDGPVLAWMESGRGWLQERYSGHSSWPARSSGYALVVLLRNDHTLPEPPRAGDSRP